MPRGPLCPDARIVGLPPSRIAPHDLSIGAGGAAVDEVDARRVHRDALRKALPGREDRRGAVATPDGALHHLAVGARHALVRPVDARRVHGDTRGVELPRGERRGAVAATGNRTLHDLPPDVIRPVDVHAVHRDAVGAALSIGEKPGRQACLGTVGLDGPVLETAILRVLPRSAVARSIRPAIGPGDVPATRPGVTAARRRHETACRHDGNQETAFNAHCLAQRSASCGQKLWPNARQKLSLRAIVSKPCCLPLPSSFKRSGRSRVTRRGRLSTRWGSPSVWRRSCGSSPSARQGPRAPRRSSTTSATTWSGSRPVLARSAAYAPARSGCAT